MSQPKQLAGVLPVFQTPFNDDDSIDVSTLEKHIGWIYEQGADGIVMAMVSETLRLGSEEREQLATLACKFGRDRGPVIISTGAESTSLAVRYSKHAEANGAAGVMVIPPVSTSVTEDELQVYYEKIIRAIKIPVIVQDASGYVGRPMSIGLQAKLLLEYGDQVMYKPEATPIGPKLSQLRDATQGRAKVFEGTGGIALVDSYRRGIVGTMPGGDLPWALVALWKALKAGDDNRIYQLSQPISALIAMQSSLDVFLAIEKYLLVKQGIFKTARVRGPVGYKLDEESRKEVDRLYERIKESVAAR